LPGYNTAAADINPVSTTSLDISLSPTVTDQQSITVKGASSTPLTESASSETGVPVENAKIGPLRPDTVVDMLPLVPGVIRTPDGRVQVSGRDEDHSSLLINSVNVNDPATGDFGLGVPVDTVDLLKVMQSPYLAQYGSFSAGVVSAETRRGGDKWDYSLNDPLPDFRIRSGHLVGLRDAAPRLNLSGPLLRNHFYFAQGMEYLIDKAEVRTLPFPYNESRTSAVNSFTQVDALLGSRNSLTGTLHFSPHALQYANLNYFDPMPVTPSADYQEDTGTLTHRLAIGNGLITSIFAGTRVATNVYGQSQDAMILSPLGNSGSYFGHQTREATRFQWLETWSPAAVHFIGQHDWQIGSVLAHAEDEGVVMGSDVRVVNTSGQLLQTISYAGRGTYSLSELEPAIYAQDHWQLNRRFAMDTGVRVDTQSLTYTLRFAPRWGFAWSPASSNATIVRGGLGIFYDSVPLDTYAFQSYPQQTITTYNGQGQVTDGPRTYLNVITQSPQSSLPFIEQQNHTGNFAPYSFAWNIETERRFRKSLAARVLYLHAVAENQLTLAPQASSTGNALVLGGSGTLLSHQLEVTSSIGASTERQFFFSYVRQFARGEITDSSTYLGDFPFPVARTPITASTSGEIPNRFLFWGTTNLPWRLHLSPHVEFRNGFTWQPVDQLQNYVSLSSLAQPRYPAYFAGDLRVAKDFNINPHHAVRLSVTLRNLTNHNNPLQVHNNIADPLYGTFFGNYGRHELLDFDLLF
jgi:hypothetical protein